MPFLRIDLVGPVDEALSRELLRRTADEFAAITESPIERIRTQVRELPAHSFAVGGIPIADSGVQAPFIFIDVLAGRPPEQHSRLIERISLIVADAVGAPLDRVRVRINEVPPEHWGIGGVSAADARADEIAARRRPPA